MNLKWRSKSNSSSVLQPEGAAGPAGGLHSLPTEVHWLAATSVTGGAQGDAQVSGERKGRVGIERCGSRNQGGTDARNRNLNEMDEEWGRTGVGGEKYGGGGRRWIDERGRRVKGLREGMEWEQVGGRNGLNLKGIEGGGEGGRGRRWEGWGQVGRGNGLEKEGESLCSWKEGQLDGWVQTKIERLVNCTDMYLEF